MGSLSTTTPVVHVTTEAVVPLVATIVVLIIC
jgi:hypothetical protein